MPQPKYVCYCMYVYCMYVALMQYHVCVRGCFACVWLCLFLRFCFFFFSSSLFHFLFFLSSFSHSHFFFCFSFPPSSSFLSLFRPSALPFHSLFFLPFPSLLSFLPIPFLSLFFPSTKKPNAKTPFFLPSHRNIFHFLSFIFHLHFSFSISKYLYIRYPV